VFTFQGNIEVKEDNAVTKFKVEDHLIQLDGRYTIIGRSIVIHADPGNRV
jgi:Cu/Zn superoxide dismutase